MFIVSITYTVSIETINKNLQNILKQDPFYKYNLAKYEIEEFIPTKAKENLKYLIKP
jgi:hypothetical protein